MKRLIPALLLVITGCGSAPVPPEKSEIGRFQFYPASGEMPAVLLDTVTGCIETYVKLTDMKNLKDISWGRKQDGAPLFFPNEKGEMLGAPKRCPEAAKPDRLRYNPETGELEPIKSTNFEVGSRPSVSNR